MSAEEIRAKVVEAVREYAWKDVPINEDSKLELDLGLDWMDKVELVMDVEEKIGILIDDDDVDNEKTVGDIVKAAQEAVQRQAEQEANNQTPTGWHLSRLTTNN